MKWFFLLLPISAVHAAEFQVIDPAAKYDAKVLITNTVVPAPCTQPPAANMGMCNIHGVEGFVDCSTVFRSFDNSCYKKIYDSNETQSLVDKKIKGSVDTLSAAVRDNYKSLVTSEDFRQTIRAEVQRLLAEQANR